MASISSAIFNSLSADLSIFEAGQITDFPAVVLLPGLTCSAYRFLESLLPLAEKTKVIAVDLPGHGQSVSKETARLGWLASDIMRLLRAKLPGSRICILAHSMGAKLLWSLLDDFSDELQSILVGIALIDPTSPGASTSKTPAGPTDVAHDRLRQNYTDIAKSKGQMCAKFAKMFKTGFLHSDQEITDWQKFLASCDPTAVANLYWENVTTDLTHVVQSMKTKHVLIVAGDATFAPSTLRQRLLTGVPRHGAHLAVLPGGTHCLFHQAELADQLVKLILRLGSGNLKPNTLPNSFCSHSPVRLDRHAMSKSPRRVVHLPSLSPRTSFRDDMLGRTLPSLPLAGGSHSHDVLQPRLSRSRSPVNNHFQTPPSPLASPLTVPRRSSLPVMGGSFRMPLVMSQMNQSQLDEAVKASHSHVTKSGDSIPVRRAQSQHCQYERSKQGHSISASSQKAEVSPVSRSQSTTPSARYPKPFPTNNAGSFRADTFGCQQVQEGQSQASKPNASGHQPPVAMTTAMLQGSISVSVAARREFEAKQCMIYKPPTEIEGLSISVPCKDAEALQSATSMKNMLKASKAMQASRQGSASTPLQSLSTLDCHHPSSPAKAAQNIANTFVNSMTPGSALARGRQRSFSPMKPAVRQEAGTINCIPEADAEELRVEAPGGSTPSRRGHRSNPSTPSCPRSLPAPPGKSPAGPPGQTLGAAPGKEGVPQADTSKSMQKDEEELLDMSVLRASSTDGIQLSQLVREVLRQTSTSVVMTQKQGELPDTVREFLRQTSTSVMVKQKDGELDTKTPRSCSPTRVAMLQASMPATTEQPRSGSPFKAVMQLGHSKVTAEQPRSCSPCKAAMQTSIRTTTEQPRSCTPVKPAMRHTKSQVKVEQPRSSSPIKPGVATPRATAMQPRQRSPSKAWMPPADSQEQRRSCLPMTAALLKSQEQSRSSSPMKSTFSKSQSFAMPVNLQLTAEQSPPSSPAKAAFPKGQSCTPPAGGHSRVNAPGSMLRHQSGPPKQVPGMSVSVSPSPVEEGESQWMALQAACIQLTARATAALGQKTATVGSAPPAQDQAPLSARDMLRPRSLSPIKEGLSVSVMPGKQGESDVSTAVPSGSSTPQKRLNPQPSVSTTPSHPRSMSPIKAATVNPGPVQRSRSPTKTASVVVPAAPVTNQGCLATATEQHQPNGASRTGQQQVLGSSPKASQTHLHGSSQKLPFMNLASAQLQLLRPGGSMSMASLFVAPPSSSSTPGVPRQLPGETCRSRLESSANKQQQLPCVPFTSRPDIQNLRPETSMKQQQVPSSVPRISLVTM